MPTTNPVLTTMAQQAANRLMDKLGEIEHSLKRQLELSESSRRNFIADGAVAGGTTIGTTPAPVLNANRNRRGLSFQNIGTAGNISLGLGSTTPLANTGLTLAPGASWDGRISGLTWLGSVSVVATQAGVAYTWVEA